MLLNYPAVDVFDLIKLTLDYEKRNNTGNTPHVSRSKSGIRRKAGDDWF